MAEAIGLASSIVALIELAKGVSTAIYKYTKAYKNAPADLKSLRAELASLVGVLEVLKDEEEENDSDSEDTTGKSSLEVEYGPLWLCQHVLNEISTKLPKPDQKMEGLKRVLWPFKDGDIKEYMTKLERAKSILSLSLNADRRAVMKEIRKMCEDLKLTGSETLETVKTVQKEQVALKGVIMARQMSEDRLVVLKWLHGDVDYEENHKEARKRHQEGTGNWFTEGSEFSEWLTGKRNLIWLHGIPGAGKTILMSTIIHTATLKLKLKDNTATAYFYFSFTEKSKQNTCNMLKSILAQLSSQVSSGFPERVINLYKQYSARSGAQPDCKELMLEIEEICEQLRPGTVYLFIDALDECAEDEQSGLFEYLEQLSKIQNLKIIVTSREEADITRALKEDMCFHPISIQSREVDKDISLFVQRLLQNDKDIKRLPPKAKDLILDRLTSGAKGMFRWVECQIEPLKKCKNTTQVTSVLAKLPKTLYETYDRILESTSENDREYLRRALAWIMYSKKTLNAVELAEAMVIEPGSETLDEDSRLGDLPVSRGFRIDPWAPEPPEITNFVSTIQAICGSLVRIEHLSDSEGKFHRFTLAHYSVQEYLTSTEIAKGRFKLFSLREREGNDIILEACLTYLQFNDFDSNSGQIYRILYSSPIVIDEGFPLYSYATEHWYHHVVSPDEDSPRLVELTQKFLQTDPLSGSFRLWRNRFTQRMGYELGPGVDKEGDPLYFMAGIGLSALVRHLMAESAPTSSHDYTALHFAASQDRHDVIKCLVDNGGADVYAVDNDGNTPIHVAIDRGCLKALRALIERTGDLNVANEKSGRTPLELAVLYAKSDEPLLMLLKAGAGHGVEAHNPLLHRTAMSARVTRTKYLLDYGADIDIMDGNGLTLYYKLLNVAHVDPRNVGVDKSSLNLVNEHDISQNYACLIETLTMVHDRGADPEATGVTITELEYHMALIKFEKMLGDKDYHRLSALALITSGADVNAPFACSVAGDTPLISAIRHSYMDLVKEMVEQGVNLDKVNMNLGNGGLRSGSAGAIQPPLNFALESGDEQLASFLLDQGAGGDDWLGTLPPHLRVKALDVAWFRRDVDLCKHVLDRVQKVTPALLDGAYSPVVVISRFLGQGTPENKDFYLQWIHVLTERTSNLTRMEPDLTSVVKLYTYQEWQIQALRPLLAAEGYDIIKSDYPSWNESKRCKLIKTTI